MSKQPNQGKKILVVSVIILTVAAAGSVYWGRGASPATGNSSAPDNTTLLPEAITDPNGLNTAGKPDMNGVFHVWPGMSIQEALDAAASHSEYKIVKVHEGTYRPKQHGADDAVLEG